MYRWPFLLQSDTIVIAWENPDKEPGIEEEFDIDGKYCETMLELGKPSPPIEKTSQRKRQGPYLIFVTDTTDGVCVKKKLAGVNFYRFNAKNWQFTVYFAVITQKIGNLLCILS